MLEGLVQLQSIDISNKCSNEGRNTLQATDLFCLQKLKQLKTLVCGTVEGTADWLRGLTGLTQLVYSNVNHMKPIVRWT